MGSSTMNIPIGTSDPLDLSKGLALIPSLGTLRAGISASSRSYKLIDIPILIICVRLKLRVYGGYGFGIVGPAVALLAKEVFVTRANNNGTEGQLSLFFSEGMRMQAGCFVQSYVAAGVTATLQLWKPQPWYKFWVGKWTDAFTIEKDFRIDVLDLLLKLIEYLLARKGNASSFTKDRGNKLKETNLGVDTFGFDMAGSSTTVTPNLRATPEVVATINLANYVPKLREINLALAKIDGGIAVGPTAHLQMPVTLNLTGFTVEGGLLGDAVSADYKDVEYSNSNRVTAKGKTLFDTSVNPLRFTTHVKYETAVRLAISIHASIKVAKFFKIGVNTPSLDLTNLLFRIPESSRSLPVDNEVSTAVGGGCVLTPNMTLRFVGPGGTLEIRTGELATGTVTLAGLESTVAVTVALEILPAVSTFPTFVTVPARSPSARFSFTFQNQCLLTGNRNDPSEMAPPSPISALQTYRVRARLTEQPQHRPCADYQADAPLTITNRFIRCQRYKTIEGPAPPWDEFAGVTIKADIDDPDSPGGGDTIFALLWFPYIGNEPTQTVPVTFTLLDENREPYPRSGVELLVGQQRGDLAPSQTFNVRLLSPAESQDPPGQLPSFVIHWKRKGPHSGYANRFYLLVNAGCQFGETEFWIDVYNWS